MRPPRARPPVSDLAAPVETSPSRLRTVPRAVWAVGALGVALALGFLAGLARPRTSARR